MILELILGLFILCFIAFLVYIIKRPKAIAKKNYPIVRAGDISKDCALRTYASDFQNKTFVFNGESIDPSDYIIFIVRGESMSNYNIHDGDAVFVKRLSVSERYSLKDNPVIVLEIDHTVRCTGCYSSADEYKLRKFIGYIGCNDTIDNIVAEYPYLSISTETINDKLTKCKDEYNISDENRQANILFTLSETKYEDGTIGYSIHPIINLFGTVKFIVPAKDFKRFED